MFAFFFSVSVCVCVCVCVCLYFFPLVSGVSRWVKYLHGGGLIFSTSINIGLVSFAVEQPLSPPLPPRARKQAIPRHNPSSPPSRLASPYGPAYASSPSPAHGPTPYGVAAHASTASLTSSHGVASAANTSPVHAPSPAHLALPHGTAYDSNPSPSAHDSAYAPTPPPDHLSSGDSERQVHAGEPETFTL